MKLRKVSGECYDGDCPAVHLSDRDSLVFQGAAITVADGLRLGHGEQAVELPMTVVREAVRALGW
jgi:hypothetical protein